MLTQPPFAILQPMLKRSITALALIGAMTTIPSTVSAQPARGCQPDQSPQFVYGFAVLRDRLGTPVMGDPTSCEYPDPITGDTLQTTTTGLAFWRKSTNTPTFTNGLGHFAITPASPLTVVHWESASIDPPPDAVPPQGAAEYACDYDLPADIAAELNCP